MEEETKTVKKEWLTPRKIFWMRFVSWALFAAILPFIFILFRFNIFHREPVVALGFWGTFALGIILAFIVSVLRYVCKAMPFSMAAQCIGGFGKVVLPLLILLFVAIYIRDKLDVFIQALSVVVVCEAVAVPINPMPKWIHEHLTEEQQKKISSFIDLGLDKFFSRKNKGE